MASGLIDGPAANVSIHFNDENGLQHNSFEPPYIYLHDLPDAIEEMSEVELQLVESWVDDRIYWQDQATNKYFSDDELFSIYPELFSAFYDENVDWYRVIKAETTTRLFHTRRWRDDAKLLGAIINPNPSNDEFTSTTIGSPETSSP